MNSAHSENPKAVLQTANTDAVPSEKADGVDLTLIRWMLTLTPAERMEYIEGVARSVEELRELNRER